ncbi:MAG TPA: flagellar export chaperone FliS [Terracidiphilus sp.]|nr:flagellar export chaperone FliS [Terracidiphilus sp.]
MDTYREHALEGASALDLVVALYDGIIRFLYAAIDAVERGDADARRAAVKRAMDIIIHLQARLRMDVGGSPAKSLSDFYAAIFAQILQASQSASKPRFEHAIDCVRNVRDAWREAAKDPEAAPVSSREFNPASPIAPVLSPTAAGSSSWTA